jgi:hypothetical protein
VGHTRRQRNGKITYISTIVFVVLFLVAFSLLLQKAFDNYKASKCLDMCHDHTHWFAYLANNNPTILGIFLSIALAQNQFLLFIAREFMLTLYDETYNKSVTKRVANTYRRYSNALNINLNDQNTQHVNDGVDKTILRTYEKLKVKEQLRVSFIVWLFISVVGLILALPAFRVVKSSYMEPKKIMLKEDSHCPNQESSISGLSLYLTSAFGAVEAALIYVMPAYLFRAMCTRFQYE